MAYSSNDILEALQAERQAAQRGAAFNVISARRQSNLVVLAIEPLRTGNSSTAVDETLEGARAVWFGDSGGRGEVVIADPERGEITLRFVIGELPEPDVRVTLYPHDFLTPLIELWHQGGARKRAIGIQRRQKLPAIAEKRAIGKKFEILRSRQKDALSLPLNRAGLLIGPPGTGKTFTVGAMIASLLCRFKNSKILVSGPTNTAVDAALISADDWLQRLGKEDLRHSLKRVGSRFDVRRYRDREHLLASGIYEASIEISMLELDEPPKKDIERYVAWKERLEAARARLQADVAQVAATARVVAITTNSLFMHYSSLANPGDCPWHFAIIDEASQIMLPAALMAGSIAKCVTFTGDPDQLAPIVQSTDATTKALLEKTAFDCLREAPSVFLDEQSRMCKGICDVVSHTFYAGKLKVCKKANWDAKWKKERSSWFLDGREVPRVLVDDRAGEATWSKKYNGNIRFQSAKIVAAWVDEFLALVPPQELLILTPFRAQRALIKSVLGRNRNKEVLVSTVHRAQGSEKKIVIFDPVDAGCPFLNSNTGRRLINVAASRAQAHLIIVAGPSDLKNPYLKKIADRARQIWDKPRGYSDRLRVRVHA